MSSILQHFIFCGIKLHMLNERKDNPFEVGGLVDQTIEALSKTAEHYTNQGHNWSSMPGGDASDTGYYQGEGHKFLSFAEQIKNNIRSLKALSEHPRNGFRDLDGYRLDTPPRPRL